MKRLIRLFWMAALTLVLSCGKEQAQNNDTPAEDSDRPIPATLDLHAGDCYSFVPKVAAGVPCYWSSKDEEVATIDAAW